MEMMTFARCGYLVGLTLWIECAGIIYNLEWFGPVNAVLLEQGSQFMIVS